jgi:hypothetical protein
MSGILFVSRRDSGTLGVNPPIKSYEQNGDRFWKLLLCKCSKFEVVFAYIEEEFI